MLSAGLKKLVKGFQFFMKILPLKMYTPLCLCLFSLAIIFQCTGCENWSYSLASLAWIQFNTNVVTSKNTQD